MSVDWESDDWTALGWTEPKFPEPRTRKFHNDPYVQAQWEVSDLRFTALTTASLLDDPALRFSEVADLLHQLEDVRDIVTGLVGRCRLRVAEMYEQREEAGT